ncbi:MAG: GNAT family N-acetyltransferase [Candidatus Baltobacteraceae bacterium]
MEVVIRLARCDERKQLEDLQRQASLRWEEYREALLANPDAIDLPLGQIEAGRCYVAERQRELLGFCVVLPRTDRDADLDGLFVDPAVWQQGIGRLLIQAAERLAASEGAESLYVVANPKALGFYTACAFAVVGEEHTRFGAGLIMRKRVGSGGRREASAKRARVTQSS